MPFSGALMGDVEKDVEMMRRLRLSGSAKLRIASGLDDFIIRVFRERIRKEHPHASTRQILKILREELFHGRRDNV
jgi:hypothetical protein